MFSYLEGWNVQSCKKQVPVTKVTPKHRLNKADNMNVGIKLVINHSLIIAFQGLFLNYRLEMTNGETFWRKHFSADERCMYL